MQQTKTPTKPQPQVIEAHAVPIQRKQVRRPAHKSISLPWPMLLVVILLAVVMFKFVAAILLLPILIIARHPKLVMSAVFSAGSWLWWKGRDTGVEERAPQKRR